MKRSPTQGLELPDYLEIGHDEVYEDPGSTLPQDLNLPELGSAQKASGSAEHRDTLPPELSETPTADTVRTAQVEPLSAQGSFPAIVASHGAKGRRPQDGPMPKRVLVVDDDLSARLYMRARLMLRGHVQIFEASNMDEGMQLLKSQPSWDAALLDVDMGEHNGFELCKAIRAWVRSQGGTQPRIYMITSRTSLLDKMRAKMAGADAFLSKPPLPYELSSLLKYM